MANVIKYSTTTPTNQSTLRRGNTVVAVGNAATSQFHSAGFKNGVDIPEGGYVVYTIGLNNNPKAFIAQDDNDLPAIARTLGGGNLTILEAKIFLNAHTNTWTLNSFPPNIVTDGLVYYSDARDMTSFMNNEPITNLVVYGTMLPTDPNTTFISNSTSQSNVGGSQWTWSYYPNSNISPEGGMEWHPAIPDPIGGSGAWLMKKRPGGNNESNWSSTPPGAIDQTKAYTISVWCKTDQASCFRIHINTTKGGSSYWGYGSAFHSGNGLWEKLSLTIPANNGNTSINVIRCQALYQYDADAYYKYFQVEEGSSATDFVNGTRSQNTLLNDLSGESNTGTLTNGVGFNEGGYLEFDGVDDTAIIGSSSDFQFGTGDFTIEALFKPIDDGGGWTGVVSKGASGAVGYAMNYYANGNGTVTLRMSITAPSNQHYSSGYLTSGKWYHIVMVFDRDTAGYVYNNGDLTYSHTALTANNQSVDNTGYTLRLGTFNGSSWFLNGGIAKVKLYNKVLSNSEVSQNYYGGPIVTDGLIWNPNASNLVSYESGSTTVYPLTGSMTGSLQNGAGYDIDNGGVWTFDGVNDYIDFPPNSENIISEVTCEVWFKPTGSPTNGYHVLFQKNGGYSGGAIYGLRAFPGGDFWGMVGWGPNSSEILTITGRPSGYDPLTIGQWYHVVCTYDSNYHLKLYVDGIYVGVNTNGTAPLYNNSDRIRIGTGDGRYTNGQVADCRIYNRPLTLKEIQQNYNAQSSRFQ
jgi:hypothetical protein